MPRVWGYVSVSGDQPPSCAVRLIGNSIEHWHFGLKGEVFGLASNKLERLGWSVCSKCTKISAFLPVSTPDALLWIMVLLQ
jgi:hypothetical protein